MAWKKYSEKTPEEKKKSWENFHQSQAIKKALKNHKPDKHPSDHEYDPNPGGYCRSCGHGRDHS